MTTQTAALRFDPVEHRYYMGEMEVPYFTLIARNLGLIDTTFMNEDRREEGVALHRWTLHLAQGKPLTVAPDERIAARVMAFQKFMGESGFKFVMGETPLYEPTYRYGVTPDLVGHIGAFSCAIDVKGGAKQKWHAVQVAAQQIALEANGFRCQKRFCLYLSDNSYRLIEHTDQSDMTRWKSLVAAYYAKTFYI